MRVECLIAVLMLLAGCQTAPRATPKAKALTPAVIAIPPKTLTLTFTTSLPQPTKLGTNYTLSVASNVIATATNIKGPWTPIAAFAATGSNASMTVIPTNGVHFYQVTNVFSLK